jgi:hypothetical protein
LLQAVKLQQNAFAAAASVAALLQLVLPGLGGNTASPQTQGPARSALSAAPPQNQTQKELCDMNSTHSSSQKMTFSPGATHMQCTYFWMCILMQQPSHFIKKRLQKVHGNISMAHAQNIVDTT